MNPKLAKHLPHYMGLIGMLAFGFVGFVAFSYSPQFQISISVATAAGYFTWGVVHHIIHKDLDVFVLVEYATIALLGVVIVLSLVFRA